MHKQKYFSKKKHHFLSLTKQLIGKEKEQIVQL